MTQNEVREQGSRLLGSIAVGADAGQVAEIVCPSTTHRLDVVELLAWPAAKTARIGEEKAPVVADVVAVDLLRDPTLDQVEEPVAISSVPAP